MRRLSSKKACWSSCWYWKKAMQKIKSARGSPGFVPFMRDDHVRRAWDVECCTPVPIGCCTSPKGWNTKGEHILRTLRS